MKLRPVRDRQQVIAFDAAEARRYLESMEAVARHGRTSPDPHEALAAIQILAHPSPALRRLTVMNRHGSA